MRKNGYRCCEITNDGETVIVEYNAISGIVLTVLKDTESRNVRIVHDCESRKERRQNMTKNKKRIILIACLLLLLLLIIVIVLFYTNRGATPSEKTDKENTSLYNKEETHTEDRNETDENHVAVEDKSDEENTDNDLSEGETTAAQPPVKENSSSGSSKSTETEQHVHKWKKTTIIKHHDPVLIKEAWTEEVPIYEEVAVPVCSICEEDIIGETPATHGKVHALAGEGSGHYTDYRKTQTGTETVQHAAEYTEAWDEPVQIETCECGATK